MPFKGQVLLLFCCFFCTQKQRKNQVIFKKYAFSKDQSVFSDHIIKNMFLLVSNIIVKLIVTTLERAAYIYLVDGPLYKRPHLCWKTCDKRNIEEEKCPRGHQRRRKWSNCRLWMMFCDCKCLRNGGSYLSFKSKTGNSFRKNLKRFKAISGLVTTRSRVMLKFQSIHSFSIPA